MSPKLTAPLLLCLLNCLAAQSAPPLVTVSVDGKALSGPADFSLPHSYRQLSFHIENSPADRDALQRFRYRLEGVDDGWREDRSNALFYAGFYNADGDRISLWQHDVSGQSAGWVFTPDNSSFTHRMKTLTVPADAQSVKFSVSTAGQPTGVGVFIVTNVAAVLSAQQPPLRFPSSQWLADGTRPSMALLLTLQNNPTLDRALSIWDADTIGHAEWRTRDGLKVRPGQTFTVEWDELYNLGFGIPLNKNYSQLRPGHYRFLAQRLDILDQPVDRPAVVLLQIAPPFWQSGWFIAVVSLAGLGAALAVFRYYLWRKLQRQRADFRLIEQERLRIAQDLHDDLGARMTHMALISAQAKTGLADSQCRASLLEISSLMKESVAALSRTVWAVNPKN
ncbi:MAG: histidine kinase, partial [Verrucomicrobiales bacterium]|nr:histidine kinase [Verrucomicrobiales bacterium]